MDPDCSAPTSPRRPSSSPRAEELLPDAHQRRDDDASGPLRPAHGALPRLPERGAGLRRRARGLRSAINMGSTLHLLLRAPPSPARTCTTATWRRPSTCRWACSATSTCGRAQDGTPQTFGGTHLHPLRLQRRRRLDRLRRGVPAAARRRSTTASTTLHLGRPAAARSPNMQDTYPMLNGRGYPDTVNPGAAAAPPRRSNGGDRLAEGERARDRGDGRASSILLRLSNLNVTNYYTVTALGLPMQVVGRGARHAARPGRQGPLLRHHLGHPRRRRVVGRHHRHRRAWRRAPTSSTRRTSTT